MKEKILTHNNGIFFDKRKADNKVFRFRIFGDGEDGEDSGDDSNETGEEKLYTEDEFQKKLNQANAQHKRKLQSENDRIQEELKSANAKIDELMKLAKQDGDVTETDDNFFDDLFDNTAESGDKGTKMDKSLYKKFVTEAFEKGKEAQALKTQKEVERLQEELKSSNANTEKLKEEGITLRKNQFIQKAITESGINKDLADSAQKLLRDFIIYDEEETDVEKRFKFVKENTEYPVEDGARLALPPIYFESDLPKPGAGSKGGVDEVESKLKTAQAEYDKAYENYMRQPSPSTDQRVTMAEDKLAKVKEELKKSA